MDSRTREVTGLFLPALFSFLCLVCYGPATVWLVRETAAHEQLLHALIILVLAGAYILRQRRERVTFSFDFGPAAIRFLAGSFLLVALGGALGWPLLIIPAYAMALLGWLLFFFGDRLARPLIPIMTGFAGYVLLVVLLPHFDWPLRYMAGRYALTLLYYLGFQAQLYYAAGQEPKLILDNNGNIFEVAAECNGFGVLGGSLLLALLLVTYGRVRWIDRALALGIAALVAIAANLGRIVIISALAPAVGSANYHLMHELVGTVTFWSALAAVWWVSHEFFPRRPAAGAETKPARVVFFDAGCGLCHRGMVFFQRIDIDRRLTFASLEGGAARALRERHPELGEVESILLVEGWESERETVHSHSDAVLRMFKTIGGVWPLLYLATVVPAALRDRVYRWIARRRRKWFGGPSTCDRDPEAELKRYLG